MLGLVIALAAASVPASQAAACSCGFPGYEEAIAAADVAFIGTVVAQDAPPLLGGRPFETARHVFEVSRSKAPMQTPFALGVASGSGASCGLEMAVGEEWLVIATAWEGELQTNLCSGSVEANALDRGELASIRAVLPHDDPAATPTEDALAIPAPLLVAGAGFLAVAAVMFAAFRQPRRGEG
jgi:hypothetical protein